MDYQVESRQTAIYPGAGTGSLNEWSYLALGLSSEAGEVAGKIKKLIRDGALDKTALTAELGDVYWYLAQLCTACGVTTEYVMQQNLNKLLSRKERNVLQGSGDNR